MNRRTIALLPLVALALCIIFPLAHSVLASDKQEPPTAIETPEPSPVIRHTPYSELLLGSTIPLDVDTQIAIYGVCECDPELFCAVMAIAATETDFRADAVGDSGISYGLCQINTEAQEDRIELLGVTDLTDPVQCSTVAVSYLRWLEYNMDNASYDADPVYMAYNMGLAGSIEAGVNSTAYSRETVGWYGRFMEELERRNYK